MTTEAKWAHGVVLKKGAVAIGELSSIGDFNLDSDEVDVTHLTSPGGFEEIVQTIRRTGVLPLSGNFVPGDAGQADLFADYYSGARNTYTIDFTDAGLAAEWNFTAFVKSYATSEIDVEGALGFNAGLRVTGQPSLDITLSANLTSIAVADTVGGLTLVPASSPTVYNYVTDVPDTSTWAEFTVVGDHGLSINGVQISSGVAARFDLGAPGTVTEFIIAHKEADKVPRRYTVNVARAS